jgi:proteic killer suppression protein
LTQEAKLDIIIEDKKLRRCLNDSKRRVRKYGNRCSDLIGRRLDQLKAAENLEIIRSLPGPRCHELTGDRKGQLAVNLEHPFRLIFVPNHNPIPTRDDGSLNWLEVTSIKIIEVVDYHG